MLSLIRKNAQWPWPLKQNSDELPESEIVPWLQNTFWNNEVYEEVEGYTYPLTAGIFVRDSKLIVDSTGRAFQTVAGFFCPAANEDFTIQLRFNSAAISNTYDILGVFLNSIATTTWRLTQTSGGVQFAFVEAGATVERTIQSRAITANTDHHVAVVRRSGAIGLYLDGQLDATIFSQAEFNYVHRQVTTRRTTVQGITGARWDIQFFKKAVYASDFDPTTPTNFVRPYYEEADLSKINSQIVVRDNEVRNEVGSQIAGSYTVSNNMLVQAWNTLDSQRIQWDAPVFGAGDFTIEVEFARSGMGGAGCNLIGDWYTTGTSTYNQQHFMGWRLTASATHIQFYPSPNWSNDPRAITSSAVSLADGVSYRVIVERVDGVISIYLNGVKIASASDIKPIVRTTSGKLNIQNFRVDGSDWPTSARLHIRDIRIVDKAMYRGDMSLAENYYPRIPGDFSSKVVGLSTQVLVPDNTVIPSTDHSIVGLSAQILVRE